MLTLRPAPKPRAERYLLPWPFSRFLASCRVHRACLPRSQPPATLPPHTSVPKGFSLAADATLPPERQDVLRSWPTSNTIAGCAVRSRSLISPCCSLAFSSDALRILTICLVAPGRGQVGMKWAVLGPRRAAARTRADKAAGVAPQLVERQSEAAPPVATPLVATPPGVPVRTVVMALPTVTRIAMVVTSLALLVRTSASATKMA